VTAGAPDISPVLVEQLDEGGVLVIPVGTRFSQSLFKVTKKGDRIEKENYTLCVFVPLIGMHGWKEN
jgi:Protein-L-isoaspartate carboxylmethyltransferase